MSFHRPKRSHIAEKSSALKTPNINQISIKDELNLEDMRTTETPNIAKMRQKEQFYNTQTAFSFKGASTMSKATP